MAALQSNSASSLLSSAGGAPSTLDTALCVKCGLCLAECPTYRLASCESASPRGRIALVQALEAGRLQPDATLVERLSACLQCRRCERICPSQVPYGAILDRGLAVVGRRLPWRRRVATALVTRPRLAWWLARLGRPLRGLLPRSGPGHRLLQRLPRRAPAPPAVAKAVPRGRVALFTGCSETLLDGEVIAAATRLLQAAGYQVVIPGSPACCGALAAHGGDPRRARLLERSTRARLAELGPVEAVLVASSGCAAHLVHGNEAVQALAAFLADSGGLASLRFRPLPAQVGVHVPCTQENVLRDAEVALRLLAHLPGVKPVVLGRPGDCCGAGGLAFVSHAAQARRLRRPLCDEIRTQGLRLVVTTNAGCGFHLGAGVRGVELLHPVTLLARQLIE